MRDILIALTIALVCLLLTPLLLISPSWKIEVQRQLPPLERQVYDLIADLQNWPKWLYWYDDEAMELDFSEPSHGEGASHEWWGPRVGSGKLWIEEAAPLRLISYRAAIDSQMVNVMGDIHLRVSEEGVHLRWQQKGELPRFIGSYLAPFLERHLKKEMEASLDRLHFLLTR